MLGALDRFPERYREAVEDVLRFITPEGQQVIARHNAGLEPGRTDLAGYLRASEQRYRRAVEMLDRSLESPLADARVLDVGGFLGAFPLALARCGVDASMAEVFEYYRGAFDDLRGFLTTEGVTVLPQDFTRRIEIGERWTVVTNMAMLEHLADSPRRLIENLRSVVTDDGLVLLEVPNIGYWPTRLRALRGRSVHPDFDILYDSEAPFLGHHREYTEDDLRRLLQRGGFAVAEVDAFNYSMSGPLAAGWLAASVYLPAWIFRSCREVLMAVGAPTRA